MQGRNMSLILAHSAEELIQPGLVSRAAMAWPILVLTPTLSLICARGTKTANTALKILR
jgi:hypothetical protein